MKKFVTSLLIIALISEALAVPEDFCNLWKEEKEKLLKKMKSPTISRDEAHEAFWSLFLMHVIEKENPNDFVFRKMEKTIDDVLYPSLNVLGKLARSNGNPCRL